MIHTSAITFMNHWFSEQFFSCQCFELSQATRRWAKALCHNIDKVRWENWVFTNNKSIPKYSLFQLVPGAKFFPRKIFNTLFDAFRIISTILRFALWVILIKSERWHHNRRETRIVHKETYFRKYMSTFFSVSLGCL